MSEKANRIDPADLPGHLDFVRALARSILKDEHLAADAVQETFAAAVTRGPRRREAVRSWLVAVLSNAARRLVRTEVSVNTVRSRLRLAREKLRARLDAVHDGDRQRWAFPLLLLTRGRLPGAGAAAVATTIAGALTMTKTKIAILVAFVLLALGIASWRFASGPPTRRRRPRGASRRRRTPDTPAGPGQMRRSTQRPAPPLGSTTTALSSSW